MRHRKTGRKLNRNSSHRKSMFRNMSNSLITHDFIRTTLPKAKELRKVIEPLITKSKVDSVANRRYVFSKLRDKATVAKLFTDIGPFFLKRQGGYTRILKCGFRTNDKAPMAIMQLVDFETKEKEEKNTAKNIKKSSKESKTDKEAVDKKAKTTK